MSRLSRPRRGVTPRRPDRRASCSHCERACIVSIVHSPGEDIWTASAPTPKARGGSDMAPHEHETGTTQEERAPALPMKEDTMDTMTMNGEDVRHELEELEKAQAVQAATQVGAQATQAATPGGWRPWRPRRQAPSRPWRRAVSGLWWACFSAWRLSTPRGRIINRRARRHCRGGDAVRSRSPRSLASAVRRRRASLGSPHLFLSHKADYGIARRGVCPTLHARRRPRGPGPHGSNDETIVIRSHDIR